MYIYTCIDHDIICNIGCMQTKSSREDEPTNMVKPRIIPENGTLFNWEDCLLELSYLSHNFRHDHKVPSPYFLC